MTTGEKIRDLRKKYGMSQEELAAVLGLSRQAVSRWETENALPETQALLKLCELFHVTADDLLREGQSLSAGAVPQKPALQQAPRNVDLHLGFCGAAAAVAAPLSVLLVACIDSSIVVYDLTAPSFWLRPDVVPLTFIAAVGLALSVYSFAKYYFKDWQPKR